MSEEIRYELLRVCYSIYPNMHHAGVGGILLDMMQDALPHAVDVVSYIPSNFLVIRKDDLFLGWGYIHDHINGERIPVHVIERRVNSPLYVLRSIDLDGDGYPLKSDYRIVEHSLMLHEALIVRLLMSEQDPSRYYDIMPQEISKIKEEI